MYKIENMDTGGIWFFNEKSDDGLKTPFEHVQHFVERNKGKFTMNIYRENTKPRYFKNGIEQFPNRWILIKTIYK